MFLLKLLLLAAIATQEGLLSWQLMTSKMLVVMIDAGLLFIFLYLQVRSANSTHMYMIYIYSVVAKITVIYYVSLPRTLISLHDETGGMGPSPQSPALPLPLQLNTYAESIHIISSTILLSILIYILFFFVTDFDLLKVRFINLEIFFCLLIITHVSIDFIDISDFFYCIHLHFFLYYFRIVQELCLFTNPVLFVHASIDKNGPVEFYSFCLHLYQSVFILFGVLLCVNIAIHAYSLPSFSYESNKRWKLSAKGGADLPNLPSNGPYLLHSYSRDTTLCRWTNDQKKAANGAGTKGYYENYPSEAIIKESSSLGIPPQLPAQLPAQLERKYSISRGMRGSTSPFSPSSRALGSTETFLPRSKVGGDAMSCLKYISIYSFFFTDVSLFMARLFLYLVFSATACSPLFIIKNLCFAIIHGSRIYRKSKFYNRRRDEKGRREMSSNGKGYTNQGDISTDTLETNHPEEGEMYHPEKYEMYHPEECEMHHPEEREMHHPEECAKNHPDERPKQWTQRPSTSLHMKESNVNAYLLSRSYMSVDTININLIKNANYNRINSLTYDKISAHFYLHYLKHNGLNFRRYMSCYVDQIEKNSMGYSLIFLFFFILIATKIGILVITYTMNFDQDLNQHLYELTYLWNLNSLKSSWILRTNSFIILAYSFCSFLLYIFTCSLFDGIFMSLMYFFNLLSFFFVLLIMSKYNPSYDMLDYFNKNKNTLVVLLLFGYLAYLFLADTYMFIYMLLGRKYITYRRRIKTRRANEPQARTAHNAQTEEEILTPISVVSSFIVKLIKHMKGPIMLNRIIISKNLIKNTRVDNFLFFCHVKEIAVKLVLYFFSCFLSLREDAINISFLLFVFFVNLVFSVMYLILSKVDRDVTMDSIFTQALFLHLSGASRLDAKGTTISKGQKEEDAFHQQIPQTTVYENYSYDYTLLFENCLNYF
eukprot:XP_002257865.1 hypothetical protein, conserved in Plasmodium species [Plasmodium knowlesi strain H]